MFLSISDVEKKYLFIWHGGKSKFHYEGKLPDNSKVFQTLDCWIEIYEEFCESRSSRGKITKQAKTSRNVRRELAEVFSELVSLLNLWLKSCEVFEQADRDALRSGEHYLTLIIDPKSSLALLPWEESKLSNDYNISYASSNFSLSTNGGGFGKRILGILGRIGENDQEILDKYKATIINNPDIDTLCQSLRNCNEDILYFGSHSDGENLYFEEAIPNDRLRRAVKAAAQQGVKILFANSCKGLGLVWLDLPLDSFIIWKMPVPNEIARDFAKFFFEAINKGNHSKAFYDARERLADKYANIPGLRSMVQLWKRSESATSQQLSVIEGTQGWGIVGVLGGLKRKIRQKLNYKVGILLVGIFLASYPIGFLVNQIGVYFAQRGNTNLANAFYKASDMIDRKRGDTYFNLAISAEKDNDIPKAIELYHKATKEGEINAYPSLARLQLVAGQYKEAIQMGTVCVDIALLKNISEEWRSNLLIICYARIAWGYWKIENLLLAKSSIERGLKYNGDDNSLFDLYCAAFGVDRDMNENAREWAEKLLEIKDNVSDLKAIKPDCVTAASHYLSSRVDDR